MAGSSRPVGIDHSAKGIARLQFDDLGSRSPTTVPEGMIRYSDIPMRMGLPRKAVTELMSAGLFEGIDQDGWQRQGKSFAPLSAIMKFEQEYILMSEIARRTGLHWQGMMERLAKLGVVPVSGPTVDGRP